MRNNKAVVVLAASWWTGCTSAQNPEEEILNINPPPQPPPVPEVPPAPQPEVLRTTAPPREINKNPPAPDPLGEYYYPVVGRTEMPAGWTFGKSFNPMIDGLTVYRESPGRCVVYPNDGVMRPAGMLPPPKDVPCDEVFADPIWDLCVQGSIHGDPEGKRCVCHIGGNPPPPSVGLSRCPVHAAGG